MGANSQHILLRLGCSRFNIYHSCFSCCRLLSGKIYTRFRQKRRRWLAGISITLNVGLLAYFKYANFFIENVNAFLGNLGMEQVAWTAIALPIGISFFTFQKITYAVDVYRNVHSPMKRIVDYMMYILMFPQLIAGPIVRYHEVADQIEDRRKNETLDNRLAGFFRFVIGLSKKEYYSKCTWC